MESEAPTPMEVILSAAAEHLELLAGQSMRPVRVTSAHGEPRPATSIERTCRNCGASFIGLAPGKTGLVGIWRESGWFCSTECDG